MFLYEVWNWVGDTSILPIKWFEFLKRVDAKAGTDTFAHVSKEYLLRTYVTQPLFDPDGFFFITTRSEVAACVLVWPVNEQECELKELAISPAHEAKGVGYSLVALALNYARQRSFRWVSYAVSR